MSEDINVDTGAAASAALETAFIARSLTESIQELAQARKNLQELRTIEDSLAIEVADLAITQKWHAAADKRREQEQYITELEWTVRNAALNAYVATGDKTPAGGVTIKIWKDVAYAVDAVTNWARSNMPMLLTLDKVRFEKAARSGLLSPDAPVSIIDDPRAQIASDLSGYLESGS